MELAERIDSIRKALDKAQGEPDVLLVTMDVMLLLCGQEDEGDDIELPALKLVLQDKIPGSTVIGFRKLGDLVHGPVITSDLHLGAVIYFPKHGIGMVWHENGIGMTFARFRLASGNVTDPSKQ